ncbi:MAG: sulfate adenylyltransferase [Candidatus Melainabacteria bacterium]|nr:MAG: sulfate adenylyltransferase [Candidatus Melainabacteria bacterium]
MTNYLDELESDSIFIIREAYAKSKNLGMLWSMGKDSTVLLHLVRKAFLGNYPIVVIHIDTSYKIPEMISWRDDFARRNNLRLIVGVNKRALADGMAPEKGRLQCCGSLKTEALLDIVHEHRIQALLIGIRGDEEGSRGKERIVSPRLHSSTWAYKQQPAELWHYYNLHLPQDVHVRIHPLLRWTELDIWNYIRREKLEVIPLYYAKDGKRYRSLGCYPCTDSIESGARNVDEIIEELKSTKLSERAGRAQDKVDTYAMQKLRKSGYM